MKMKIKPLISHFNINDIGGLKCLLFELIQRILVSIGKEVQEWPRKHIAQNSNQVETS